MKKSLFLISILGMFSCSSELEEPSNLATAISNEPVILSMDLNKTKAEKDILNYITQVKFGNQKARQKNTEAHTLIPYLYKGDTVMYIANYGEGWDLYSADQRTPLIMASAETGSFDPNDQTMAPALKAYLNSIAEELYQIKQQDTSEGTTYGLWQTVSIQNDEVDQQKIEVAPRAVGTQPGTGHWVLLSTTSPVTTQNTSNRLTSTRWGQDFPWNAYVPFIEGSTTQHCKAGCSSVAAAQYLYYLHYKNNKPTNTFSTATYQASNNTYTYTNSNSSVWGQMAKTTSNTGTNYAAVLIGYAGKSINTLYGSSLSEAFFSDAIEFINNEGNYNYYVTTIDYNYITRELIAGRAVMASALNTDGRGGGHDFIIDRYQSTTTTTTSTFGWVGTDNLGQQTNEYDKDGNVIGYSFFYDKENKTTSYSYGMNWGWNNHYWDDTFCTASDNSDWAVDFHFNSTRRVAKQ